MKSCRDHWILINIYPDKSLAIVMDSLRRDPNQYKDMTDMLNKKFIVVIPPQSPLL